MAEPQNPPNKTQPTTSTATHRPPKHPHVDPEEIKDTASSEPKQQDEVEEVKILDKELYQELFEYEVRNGVNPVEDYDHMQRFLFPYLHMGVGNQGGWDIKIRHLKYKFENESDDGPLDRPEQMEEFLLWKRMFACERPSDAGSRIM